MNDITLGKNLAEWSGTEARLKIQKYTFQHFKRISLFLIVKFLKFFRSHFKLKSKKLLK